MIRARAHGRDGAARSVAALACAASLVAALGCASPSVAPLSALEPLPTAGAYVPDDVDLALRDVARALLAGDAEAVDEAVARTQEQDAARAVAGAGPSGAVPYALDARHALTSDPALYRSLAALLLERDDLPPELRARLAQEVADDPLRLADARIRDARTLRFGRAFNAVVEAAGRSFSNTALLAYRVANALLQVAVAEHADDELSLPERQALRHWKQFVEQHPDAPETPAVLARIDEAQTRWYRTQRDRAVRASERALGRGDARLALAFSERAVRYAPEDSGAVRVARRAEDATRRERERATRSEGAALREDAAGAEARALAIALLASSPGPDASAPAAPEDAAPGEPPADPDGSAPAEPDREPAADPVQIADAQAPALPDVGATPQLAALARPPSPEASLAKAEAAARPLLDSEDSRDEARYALALVVWDRGEREAAWDAFGDLASESDRDSNAARHARALVESPEQNPRLYWQRARRAELGDKVRWTLLGPLANGPRERDLPRALEWLIELPTLVPVATGLPQRLVRAPFLEDERRSPAVFARRALAREPDGERADELREWLVKHEERRGNPVGALAVAEGAPVPDAKKVAKLRRKAAEQMLEFALEKPDLPTRVALLRKIGREYEGTPAAAEAVDELRRTMREATPQHIRISRGFLQENPEIIGPAGLALRAGLLDGDGANGELHPDGVTLLAGDAIEVAYLPESGDPRDEPVRRREHVSEARVARLVAALEEASLRNARTDRDYPIEFDADRDL
ncbi:MAG TPA: hypothetical protein VHQ66_14120, partial [Myxococcota bacterium]|nr:hypothetical protein [Myxococcota bacterium]